MSLLRNSPFSLVQGTLITAEVLAHNERGWSIASPANTDITGPKIQTEPLVMSAPSKGASTSSTQVEIDWTA